MLEVMFGILSFLGDVLAPTKAVKWYYGVMLLIALLALVAVAAKSS